jgi:beta-glucosidase-like glycosyl hydrolase
MSNTVNIPESVKEIKNAIARRITILAEWQTKLAKTRKNSLRNSRQLQVNATRQQITELQNALAVAIEEEKHQEAKAFVARLAPVRKDFLNGLFD